MPDSGPYIVTLDVGSSSVRTALFNATGEEQAGFGDHAAFQITTTHDGGAELDADVLLNLCAGCLAAIHRQVSEAGIKPAAVALDTFWHNVLGIDLHGKPVTPIMHLFDTRSIGEVAELKQRLDPVQVHRRTGCPLYPSYWPSKLMWLSRQRPEAFKAAQRWVSLGEYLSLQFLGVSADSTSMMSGSGLWNQAENDYDELVLSALPASRGQLSDVSAMDRPATRLAEIWRSKLPLFDEIPWFPALGDGACNNIGSGCATVKEFSIMVGTSGAMRVVVEGPPIDVPAGLWCYRVDRKRIITGGSLSNGGDVYAWMRRTLVLPSATDTEAELRKRRPGEHDLLVLPFFAGERSPYWRPDLRAAITGIDLATQPMDILQAALESVALRFREIFMLMTGSLGRPRHVIASGGALLASEAWTQMMSDAMGVPVVTCLEQEATSRGAALLALERLGAIPSVTGVPYKCATAKSPDETNARAYTELEAAQDKLFKKLFTL